MKIVAYKFVVDEKPICYWIEKNASVNSSYLKSVNRDHWFLISSILKGNESMDKVSIAVHARLQYLLALETMFGMLFAALQAPEFIIGWLQQYRPENIRNLVEKINKGNKILTMFPMCDYSWKTIYNIVHFNLHEDENYTEEVSDEMVKYLRVLANDMNNLKNSTELNAMKHGCRFEKGGFGLSFGPQEGPGIPAPKSKMVTLGSSETGLTYYNRKRIKGSHYTVQKKSVNWTVDSCIAKLELVGMFINNIKVFLCNVNNIQDDSEYLFPLPTELEKLTSAMKPCSVCNFDVELPLKAEVINEFTDEQILSVYDSPRYHIVKN